MCGRAAGRVAIRNSALGARHAEYVPRSDRLRLATFNLKHGAPARSDRGDSEAVAVACADLEADVLALQEVDVGLPRSGRADLATAAAQASGMSVVFGPTLRIRGGQYGNALLVRGEIERLELAELDGASGIEPRNAILATARVAGHGLSVAATHLATQRVIGRKQLSQAVARLQAMPEPWVLMGDLNLPTDDVLAEPLLQAMELVGGPPTHPAWWPRKRIDHIAVRGLALDADSVRTVRSRHVSDHLALVADVMTR